MAKQSINLKGRCMFPALDQPKAFKGQPEESAKYSIRLLIPKSDKAQISALKEMIKTVVNAADLPAVAKKQILDDVTNFRDGYNDYCIIKDGDMMNARLVAEEKEPREAYEGNFVINAKRNRKNGAPAVYGKDNSKIPAGLVAGTIVGGYYVLVNVSAYVYTKPKPGVTLDLQAVRLVKEGEAFGQSNPFADIEVEQDENPDDESPFDKK